MDDFAVSPYWLNNIATIIAAVASMAATWSSWRNRKVVKDVDRKVDIVSVKADDAKKAAIVAKNTAAEVSTTIAEANAATIEKIEEVKQAVNNTNGKH